MAKPPEDCWKKLDDCCGQAEMVKYGRADKQKKKKWKRPENKQNKREKLFSWSKENK